LPRGTAGSGADSRAGVGRAHARADRVGGEGVRGGGAGVGSRQVTQSSRSDMKSLRWAVTVGAIMALLVGLSVTSYLKLQAEVQGHYILRVHPLTTRPHVRVNGSTAPSPTGSSSRGTHVPDHISAESPNPSAPPSCPHQPANCRRFPAASRPLLS